MALYRFGDRSEFAFDSATGDVARDGRSVRLRPQPARALEHLLQHQGELVTRVELRQAIWPDGTFVHFDDGLNSCIKQIRAALDDSRTAPRYLQTLVKRGFRFVAPVEFEEVSAATRGAQDRVHGHVAVTLLGYARPRVDTNRRDCARGRVVRE